MSNLAMGVGTLLLILVFFMDDTKFLLNVQVQEVGLYLQAGLFQLNLWTDAFGQLKEGSGRARRSMGKLRSSSGGCKDDSQRIRGVLQQHF
jgi:BCCT, betaine/carnitine/choline family transporter